MYRSSPFRSTLNTNVFTGLDMCEVCTEAVHSSTTLTRFCGTTEIFRLHFRGALFADSTTLPRFCVWHPADSTTLTRVPYQPGVKNNIWRCISYQQWWFSIAMLVLRGGIAWRILWRSLLQQLSVHSWTSGEFLPSGKLTSSCTHQVPLPTNEATNSHHPSIHRCLKIWSKSVLSAFRRQATKSCTEKFKASKCPERITHFLGISAQLGQVERCDLFTFTVFLWNLNLRKLWYPIKNRISSKIPVKHVNLIFELHFCWWSWGSSTWRSFTTLPKLYFVSASNRAWRPRCWPGRRPSFQRVPDSLQ